MSKSILIIEDNEELRGLYRDVFKHHNFTVYEAGDGILGVESALLNSPSVIVLDLMLPRQGGLATLRVLRSHPQSKHIPIIVLTALPNPDYKAMAGERVQGYYLKTEVNPSELVQKIQELLT